MFLDRLIYQLLCGHSMRYFSTILVLIALILGLAAYDTYHWGNVNHEVGLVISVVVLSVLSLREWNLWPIFVYAAVWNPFIAVVNGLPFFYLGDTAKFDIVLKNVLGSNAGAIWFLLMLVCSFITLWYANRK